MSDNPKNHPKGSGNPATGPGDTNLDLGATIIPRKAGDAAPSEEAGPASNGTGLGSADTIQPGKQPQAAVNSPSPTRQETAPTEPPAAPEPASTPSQSTSERHINSASTMVPAVKPFAPPPEKETAEVDYSTVPPDLSAGRKLGDKGRFTLIRELGRGGMGVVWLARDKNFNEDVALKLLPPEVASDLMALSDLRHETQESRKLTHEHIIRIHDLFEKDGEPAFVSMEFVDGPNLRKKLGEQAQRCFAWEHLCPMMLDLCDALEYAHKKKVIHRDLKPANVMLEKGTHIKLADFGIAATMSDSLSRVSQHGQDAIEKNTSGTLPYMSPQQLRGDRPKPTDDIYSLGAMLYELLTSKPPFYAGVPAAVMDQIKNEPARPLQERLEERGIRNEIPAYVGEVILDCLAKKPENRPQSAAEVKERLAGPGGTAAWAKISAAYVPPKPELGPDGTVKVPVGSGAEYATTGEVLDVGVADTRKAPGQANPIVKLAGVCVAIILLLGLAWHFASKTVSEVKPPSDGPMSETKPPQVTPTRSTDGGPEAVKPPNSLTPVGANSPKLTVNPPGNPTPATPGTVTPAPNTPNLHRLVILPDKLSDSASAQLSRNLQDQLGIDSAAVGDISLAGYLQDAFVNAKDAKGFTVLERSQLEPAVLKEIDLSAGKYGEAELTKIGHLATADYILVTEIPSFSITVKKQELLNIPKPRITTTGTMKVGFRVVDGRTSTILSSSSANVTESITQMGELDDKAQAARDIAGKLLNKAAQAEIGKVYHDVLNVDPPAAAPAK